MPSQSVDDYLKAILELDGESGPATNGDLSARLGVTPASVSGMLRKLSDLDEPLVEYEKHRGARLTHVGRRRALEVLRHHRLLETFLHRTLGYGWDEVHAEAERLEHAISEKLEDRIDEVLGHPETDPHGHPIPRKDGSLPERTEAPLLEMTPGDRGRVSRVPDLDPEVLRFLAGLGLTPGTPVRMVRVEAFDGPVLVSVNDEPEPRALGRAVAGQVYVTGEDTP